MFPVGGLRKEEVKRIASQAGFTHEVRQKEVRLSPVCLFVVVVYACVVVVFVYGRVWGFALLERETFLSSSVK